MFHYKEAPGIVDAVMEPPLSFGVTPIPFSDNLPS
jgi:hypothetical protein